MDQQDDGHPFLRLLDRVGIEVGKKPYLSAFGGRVMTLDALGYITDGHGFFESRERGRQAVGPGTLLVQPAGVWHCHDPAPGTRWTECWILYRAAAIPPLFGAIAPQAVGAVPIGVRSGLIELWQRLYDVWPPFGAGRIEDACLLLHRLLHEVHRAIAAPAEPPRTAALRRADSLIRADVRLASFDAARIAREVGMGYHAFRAAFRAHFGVPPKRYWLRLKMERAEECLANTGMSVGEVAAYLGMEDPWYFSRLYRRLMGRAPSAVRSATRPVAEPLPRRAGGPYAPRRSER